MAWNTTGCNVVTSKDSASSVLFSKSGETTIRQCETVLVTETRGLTENAAKSKVTPPTYTDYAETAYFRVIDNVTYKIVVRTGTETRHTARRADESNQWIYTKTQTTFAPNVTVTNYGWSTTDAGRALTDAGVTVPISQDKTATYQFQYAGDAISSVVTSTVQEIRLLTETGKNNYLAQASAGATMKKHVHGLAYSWFNDGTDVMVSARYVSAEEGWTVTKTTKVYSFSGNGWSLV